MRIVHVYKDYFPVLGGIENHIRLLAEGQVRRGHDVTVLVTNPAPRGWRTVEEMMNGVRVVRAARLVTVASTPLSLSLFREVGRFSCDVIHLHFPYPVGEVAQWLFGPRTARRVLTYHSDVVRQKVLLRLYAPIMYRILADVDRILSTSRPYAESSPLLRRFRDRVRVVPLGIETARFRTASPERVAAWRTHLAPGGEPLVLFVGRLRYYKGLDVLLQALPHVPEARLIVVGDGPMRENWQRLAARLNLGARVVFLGNVPDEELPALYHAADLFVLPATARSEAFGTVLVEAMAAGLPLVSTDVGTGTSWVNQHGKTGLVVPANNPVALAAAISQLLENPAQRQAMGMAGQHRALAEFDVERMVDRVLEVYREVAAFGPPSTDEYNVT